MKKYNNKLILFFLFFLFTYFANAQDITITGSCFAGTQTFVLGGDSSIPTLNGKPVYYNANVDIQGSAEKAQGYLAFLLKEELGTPEDRWVILLGGQPYFYAISTAATAPSATYSRFDEIASLLDCTGSVVVTPPNSAPTDLVLTMPSVNENVPANSIVGVLTSTDPDVGNTFNYSLVSGTGDVDNAYFSIFGNTLLIRLSPDFEAKNFYSIRIRTTDQAGASLEKVFIVNVINVCDIELTASSQINVSCNGGSNGSLTVVASSGASPYSYSWSNGKTTASINNLARGNYTVTVTDASSCTKTQIFSITEPPVLTTSKGVVNNVSCNGGSNGTAAVNAAGGTSPYTYLWSNGATSQNVTGLTKGNYSVTVTDSKLCEAIQNFSITEPDALSLTASQTDIVCNGYATGSASIVVTGGTGAYSYSWNPPVGTSGASASNLTAGTYTVTATDAKNCSIQKEFIITEPLALTASKGTTVNVNCHGEASGSATVNVTGGTGSYSYSWAPSGGVSATASGLAAGTYTVTITDQKSCTTSETFTITQPAAALTATGTSTKVSCFGASNGSASVTVLGGSPAYSYSWTPLGGTGSSISNRPAGTYKCTITDSKGCTTLVSVEIETPNAISGTFTKTDVSCNGNSNGTAEITPSGGTGAYTYSWSPSGLTTAKVSGLAPGNYIVTITDANGCTGTVTVPIVEPAVLEAAQSRVNILCKGSSTGSASVVVTGGTSNYAYLWSPSGGTGATASNLAAGNYSCLITDARGCTLTKVFTIEEPNELIAIQSQINATCTTLGEASVAVSGGFGVYTYNWSPSGAVTATAAGLSEGTHEVLITDQNGCTLTKTFNITTINTLNAVTSQVNVSCNGSATGSAAVVPNGAPGPFTYVWSPSGGSSDTANNLTAGNYSVTITSSNGCSTVKNFTITEPSALKVSPAGQNNVSCKGGTNGSASVTATGGSGSYTYDWAPYGGSSAAAAGLSAGTYTVTVKDGKSCVETQVFTIKEPEELVAAVSQSNVSCNGANNGTATVDVIGGTGAYTYSWLPSGGNDAKASNLSPGTYTVTVTDANSCQTTASVKITEPTVLSAVISQTDVSCNGANDGTASAVVTGGTETYTYLWSPSNKTTAAVSGLSPNTYTVTITDTNACTLTKTVIIGLTKDVTAPKPALANLPDIVSYCSILSSDISIPTAQDNCAGILKATTLDPLSYSTVGTYTITWKYDDGNGNSTTQLQTLKVLASPLDQVTFNDAEFTYDGNAHSVKALNVPAGATVTYSANNGAVNTGTYSVKATITPAASSPNCTPVILTANLIIKKAAQQITFSALSEKTLGANNSFSLTAASNSKLPISYSFTYDTALPPAAVSETGIVNLIRSGEVLITAHQTGNDNYLPASDVSQLLVILNNNIDIKRITLGGKVFENPVKAINHVMACGDNNPNVSIVNETNAVISPSANFTIQTPKPGIYSQNVKITSEDGSASETYTITVEKPFSFYDIVHQKFNNVLLVNNNPQTNGGYEFVSYQWFKNGQLIGTGQYYSAGNDLNSTLDPNAEYSVKMTTKDGKVLQTCGAKITFTNSLQAKLYPNPIETGKMITIEADFPEKDLKDMQISLFSVTGQLIKTVKSSSVKTEIQLPPTTEGNMYLVLLEGATIKKSFKVIVK